MEYNLGYDHGVAASSNFEMKNSTLMERVARKYFDDKSLENSFFCNPNHELDRRVELKYGTVLLRVKTFLTEA